MCGKLGNENPPRPADWYARPDLRVDPPEHEEGEVQARRHDSYQVGRRLPIGGSWHPCESSAAARRSKSKLAEATRNSSALAIPPRASPGTEAAPWTRARRSVPADL